MLWFILKTILSNLRSDIDNLKKESLEQVFTCEFCEISKNTFFSRTPPVAAFVYLGVISHI